MNKLIAISLLKPHPRNKEIYGEEDIKELALKISESKWIKPLVINEANIIISGNRRQAACISLGIKEVPYEVVHFENENQELERLLLENESREKTNYQKLQEGKMWEEVQKIKAKEKMSLGGQGKENFPTLEKGQTRDIVADKVGLGSGKTYESAKKVGEHIDKLKEAGKEKDAEFLTTVLNTSISGAKDLMKDTSFEKIPEDLKEKVINKEITVKKAVQEIKKNIEQVKEPKPTQVIETNTIEEEGFSYDSLLRGFKTLSDTFIENMKIYVDMDEEIAESMAEEDKKKMKEIAETIEKLMGKIKSKLV